MSDLPDWTRKIVIVQELPEWSGVHAFSKIDGTLARALVDAKRRIIEYPWLIDYQSEVYSTIDNLPLPAESESAFCDVDGEGFVVDGGIVSKGSGAEKAGMFFYRDSPLTLFDGTTIVAVRDLWYSHFWALSKWPLAINDTLNNVYGMGLYLPMLRVLTFKTHLKVTVKNFHTSQITIQKADVTILRKPP